MQKFKKPMLATALLLALAVFTACAAPGGSPPAIFSTSIAEPAPSSSVGPAETPSSMPGPRSHASSIPQAHTGPCIFNTLADKAIAEMKFTGRETPFDKVEAAFRYVALRTTYLDFDDPELTDSWRDLDTCGTPPTIYQVMGFSPLYYGLGSCENYACALMLLLERMGFKTRYVSGLTYSIQGHLVDHAWAMVEIGGNWYHIDPQLEDNVTLESMVYRYYLKSDDEFIAHHVWGKRLPYPDAAAMALPSCPMSAKTPLPVAFVQPAPPSQAVALEEAQALRAKSGSAVAPEITETLPLFPSAAAALQTG